MSEGRDRFDLLLARLKAREKRLHATYDKIERILDKLIAEIRSDLK